MIELTDTDVLDEYTVLRHQFLDGVPKRFDRINQLIQELSQVDPEESYSVLASLHYEVHKLTGASGSYGYTDIEGLARSLEETIFQHLNEQLMPCTKNLESYVEYITLINQTYTQCKDLNS